MNPQSKCSPGQPALTIVRGATSALAMQACGVGCGYLFAIAATRTAGAEAWGTFALSWSVASLGVVIGRLGVDTALLRFAASTGIAASHPDRRRLIKSAYAIVLAAAAATTTIVLLLGGWIAATMFGKPELAGPIRLIGSAILPASLLAVGSQILRGSGRIGAHVFYQRVGRYAAALVLLPVVVVVADKDTAFMWAFTAGYCALAALGSIHAMIAVRPLPQAPGGSPSEPVGARSLATIGVSMTIANLLLYARGAVGLLILGSLMPTEDVGIFSIALRVAAVVAIPLAGVSTIAAPRFAEANRIGDQSRIEETARIAGVVIVFLAVPAALVLFLFPAGILSFFGPEFRVAAGPLRWLVAGQAINALAGPVGYLLLMTGHEVAYRNFTVGVVASIAFLYWLLIPRFGLTGAAIAEFAGLALWNVLMLAYARSRFGIWPLAGPRDLLRVRTWAQELIRQAQAT